MPRKVNLFFKIVLPYRKTWYGALKDIGGFYFRTRTGKLLWIFPVSVLPKVIEIIGTPIEVDEKDAEIAYKYSKLVMGEMKLKETKEEGYIEIHELKDAYRIYTVVGKEEQVYEIPKENVIVVWNVMLKHQLGEKVPSREVAKEICLLLGLKRFFRGERFNWEEFFGSRREYYHYFYLPIKVLEHKKLVKHHKRGYVERISEKPLEEKKGGEKGE